MTLRGAREGVTIIPREQRSKMQPKSSSPAGSRQNIQSSPWNPETPLTPTSPGRGGNDHLT